MSKGGEERAKTSASTYTRDIRCPFFRRHSPNEIRCEGMMDGTSHAVIFERVDDKRFWQRTYCEKAYDKCEYCIMLMQSKYNE